MRIAMAVQTPTCRARSAVAWLTIALAGCGTAPPQTGPGAASESRPAVGRVTGDKLVAGAVSALSKLDEFDEQRAYEQAFDRLTQWSHQAAGEVASPASSAHNDKPRSAALEEPIASEASAAAPPSSLRLLLAASALELRS